MKNLDYKDGVIWLKGDLSYKTDPKFLYQIKKFVKKDKNLTFNFENVKSIDYFLAVNLNDITEKNGIKVVGINGNIAKIFDFVRDDGVKIGAITKEKRPTLFYIIGEKIFEIFDAFIMFCNFLGEFFVKLLQTIINPKKIRPKEISSHAYNAGIGSLFIVGLTSFLIGIVLAYIAADMLANFGATIYTIDLMGMIMVREIGPLIASIVVAGRLASSFTAQIGVMKITEEIDAMKTMGFDPFLYLTIPRVIAMLLCMPLIVFLANIIGLFGQMIVCSAYIDISFSAFIDRFGEVINVKHFYAGMIKAPFFGAAIAIIGCLKGFEVSGSTQSIGEQTTKSVVTSIFFVIAIDAFFAVLFSRFGI